MAIRQHLLQCKEGRKETSLEVWKDVQGGKSYVIGVDAAAGLPQGDFSVAVVLDAKTCAHCATLRGRIPPDLFAEQVERLGRRYNIALIAVEREASGNTVLKVLRDKSYPNIYFYRDFTKRMGTEIPQPGWLTSSKTRPMMIDYFNSILRSNSLESYSKNLFQEASSFIYIGVVAKAAAGQYDDELMAMLIALIVRETSPTVGVSRHAAQQYTSLQL